MAADFDRAQREAERLIEKYEITCPPVDPEEIAEGEGVDVVYSTFNGQLDALVAGFIERRDHHSRIVVNKSLRPSRKTYTIAHELGHFILHRDYVDDEGRYQIFPRLNSYEGTKPSEEREADAFAANLLVPIKLLREYKDFASTRELAAMFMVSHDVILHRLKRAKI